MTPLTFGCVCCQRRFARLDAMLAHWRRCRQRAYAAAASGQAAGAK